MGVVLVLVIAAAMILVPVLGFAWDMSLLNRGEEFRGLTIAALAVRALGPLAGFIAYVSYPASDELFGGLGAIALGIAWTIPFTLGALFLELILLVILRIRRSTQPAGLE